MILTTEGKRELSRESILKEVNEVSLWRYYTDTEVRHGKHLKDDTSAVFYICRNGTILLKDFAKETYNIWSYLEDKYDETFAQVLLRIANDFQLNYNYEKKKPSMVTYAGIIEEQNKALETSTTSIRVVKKPLSLVGAAYWQQYGISPEHLEEDSVSELDHYWLLRDDNAYKFNWSKENPIFCKDFSEELNMKNKYKIYKPLAPKDQKHYQNIGSDVLYGFKELPPVGHMLIITKSYKDWRVLKNMGYTALGFQGESSTPKPETMLNLRKWFNKVVVFFDNDTPGIQAAKKLDYHYGLKNITIPIETGVKDPSDHYKEYGHNKTIELCQNLIREIE